jgi:NADH-quinone oxidoreductase subunit C
MRPPGVPDPNEWGPLKGTVPPPETPARRAPGERPARPARAERPARPAPGDRPVRDIEHRATPGAPGDPKAEQPGDEGTS